MPTVVTESSYQPGPTDAVRKPLTRAVCAVIEASGVWEGQHLELVEGEMIDKMGKNQPHVIGVRVLRDWLIQVFGGEYVMTEAPIDVSPEDNPTSEPEPDLIVFNRSSDEFSESRPGPKDLRLVVEVSDSTVALDLGSKARLYARAEIVEYWVLDIPGRRLLVHRDPHQGKYRLITAYGPSESVAPLAAPDREFSVGIAFPR